MPKKKASQRRKSSKKGSAVSVEFYRATAKGIVILSCYLTALLIVVSFFPLLPVLGSLQKTFFSIFGWAMIFVPFILVFFGLYVQKVDLSVSKFHVILGSTLTLFSLLALTSAIQFTWSGMFGARVWGMFTDYLPSVGVAIFLIFTTVAGFAIMLGRSLEQVLQFFAQIFTGFFSVFTGIFSKFHSQPLVANSVSYIEDPNAPDEEARAQRQAIKDPIVKQDYRQPKPVAPVQSTQKQTQAEALIKQSQPFPEAVWEYPPISLFTDSYRKSADRGDIKKNSQIIEKTLESFGIQAKVVEIDQGPAVTRYCLQLTQGTKISKITSLQYDLALALAAHTGEVRIEAPIPGKALVGVEIPNRSLEVVPMRAMLDSEVMKQNKSKLTIPLGFDAASTPKIADITKMPHLLVAGTTNSGKSVMLNAIITSFLYRASPNEIKLILVDPKRVEMASYNGLPHLMCPVINDPKETLSALKWAIKEMGDRYQTFSEVGARNIASYNEMSGFNAMPYIVIIIDEFADLMMYAPNEVEEYVCRLAQMARAVGIHLIIATQRPSVDVITGLIKANIPARVAFNVSSMVDSRVILDGPGAEKLLGRGDMLYLASDSPKPVRIQAPFVRDDEIQNLINFIKGLGVGPTYTEEVLTQQVNIGRGGGGGSVGGEDGDDQDALFEEARRIVLDTGNASASFLQRKLKVGYARAARLIDQLESAGIVGPSNGSKGREVLRGGGLLD